MITIIGDTHEELAILQSVINTGILNDHDMFGRTFDATYKLSSGNLILTDKYGNIVGEKSEQEPRTEKVIKMRDVTSEERESVVKYVKSISKPTGVNFWDLEQEPCEDAISRQAALNCLTATGLKQFDFVIDARSKIKSLPPVNPQEPKEGHWIGHFCSECGEEAITEWNETGGELCLSNYCPNCGARMKSEG